jgi:hypothetical protein
MTSPLSASRRIVGLQQASVQCRPNGFGAKPESTVMMYAESFMRDRAPVRPSQTTVEFRQSVPLENCTP